MKIKIDKKEFEIHLNNISKALNANSPLHSLQGIKITATGNSVQLIASNGNLSIKEEIQVSLATEVIEPGKILVPGKLFKDVIKKQDDKILITKMDDSIEITSSDTKTHINLLNETDYPVINFDSFGKDISIEVEKLKKLIKNVSFAAAEADKRIILNGVNLKASDSKLIATATNSFRLAYQTMSIDEDVKFDINIFSKNLKDFIPINAKGLLKISVNDSKIITKYETTTIVSNLIDGVYPEVVKLIPQSYVSRLTIDVVTIDNLIEKATVVANENSKVVKLSINAEELVIESKRDEVGSTIVKSTEMKFKGNPIEIAFDALFFKEALTKFKGEVNIEFSGAQKPFLIKGDSEKELIQLVLPHRNY